MKTKFILEDEKVHLLDKETEKYYLEYGFTFYCNEIIKIFDREINLNIGDNVGVYEWRIITWKGFDIDDDCIVYYIKEE